MTTWNKNVSNQNKEREGRWKQSKNFENTSPSNEEISAITGESHRRSENAPREEEESSLVFGCCLFCLFVFFILILILVDETRKTDRRMRRGMPEMTPKIRPERSGGNRRQPALPFASYRIDGCPFESFP